MIESDKVLETLEHHVNVSSYQTSGHWGHAPERSVPVQLNIDFNKPTPAYARGNN